jgi:hypothetical protein
MHATAADALFTTYAAVQSRTHYKTDQGYQFQWTDDDSPIGFTSKDGPNAGLAFQLGERLIFRIEELHAKPVVTASYSDLVKYYYYPLKDLRVEAFVVVYSSETLLMQFRIKNEGCFPVSFTALPYLYVPSDDSLPDIEHQSFADGYTFPLVKKRDGWMVEHNIPVSDTLTGSFTLTGCRTLTGLSFCRPSGQKSPARTYGPNAPLVAAIAGVKRTAKYVKGIIRSREFTMYPGDAASFRMSVSLSDMKSGQGTFSNILSEKIDMDLLMKEDELAYSKIPMLGFKSKDEEMLYWSAFSLMRQCMMPPEGKCRTNYYVFSREPRWGWGYGGQVFHESLAMLAYAYMDPIGAMNSQRVFMERQLPNGYINYRTGPYLDETIETEGKQTSSAPWFNYTNLEIYKVTRDRQFLKEAYVSGRKFYQFYVANRDSNRNGLCEWGAHAELESVRDARVAVWDKVGWPAAFEGPDLNAMLVMEARSLAEMAKLLGLPAENEQWNTDARNRSELINETMWDDETGFYYNVNKANQSFSFHSENDLKIKEIIGFLPLWAGIPDTSRAKILIDKMQDPAEFWRPYGVPSLTAASEYYNPIGYWNGPVWVQWNYLLYRGLRDYGFDVSANQLSDRVLDNMIYHLKRDHVFWEFYSADDRQAGWNKTYIWAGIATRFLIDSQNKPKQPTK